jgi:hypothetical protein
LASWPGAGTPTALPSIGRSRGIIRGQGETDASYASRLRGWLDRWRLAGSAEGIARALHEYLGNHPRVRVIQRSRDDVGLLSWDTLWVTVGEDGTITREIAPWNWDGTSHPERNPAFWSDLWIVIYPTQWAHAPTWGAVGDTWGDDGYGLGHDVSREEYDAVLGQIAQWKAAHTRVRAVVWTSDGSLFDPDVPSSGPDGTWGAWGGTGSGPRTASGREMTSCRYWEPR